MPSEAALEVAGKIISNAYEMGRDYLIELFADAIDEAEIRGMEEAAGIADSIHEESIDEHTSARDRALISGRIDGQRIAADRIRAAVESEKSNKRKDGWYDR